MFPVKHERRRLSVMTGSRRVSKADHVIRNGVNVSAKERFDWIKEKSYTRNNSAGYLYELAVRVKSEKRLG